MRLSSPHLVYSPFLQSFLSSDENDFVRLQAVRRFFTTTAAAKCPSSISAMTAGAVWHPSALMGCTDGSVVACNSLRRLMSPREKQYQQTWFIHDWARGSEPACSGFSRFQDGFPAERINLLKSVTGDQKKSDRKVVNGVVVVTIYEEATHVTALAWNPNQACAGWASAGMGCGLIRIEDLAL